MLYTVNCNNNTVCWLAHIGSLAFCVIFMTMTKCHGASCPLIAFRLATPLLVQYSSTIYMYVTRFEKNQASTHTISNLPFHQKWITGSIHYHIPLLDLLQSHGFGFCGSFSQTLCKPRAALWRHWMVMALLYWCLEGWTSHEGLANVCYLQFGVL